MFDSLQPGWIATLGSGQILAVASLVMYYIPRRPVSVPRGPRAFSTIVRRRRTLLPIPFLRRAGYIALLGVSGYIVDQEFYARTVVRNLRTFWTVRVISRKNSCTVMLTNFLQCALIATDYKLNFTPGKSDHISALHERVGDRLLNLFSSNGGLYIKFGASTFQKFIQTYQDIPRPSNRGKCRVLTKAYTAQVFPVVR